MILDNEIKNYYRILYSYCTQEQRRYIYQLRKRINFKINSDPFYYGLVDFTEALLSMDTYSNIRKLITFPEKTIVVDCGCGLALQQVMFQDCKGYIGIDTSIESDPMFSGCTLIKGDIGDVLNNLELGQRNQLLGVSVMCCSCFKDDILEAFKAKFDRMITI